MPVVPDAPEENAVPSSEAPKNGVFPKTRWSIVLAAGGSCDQESSVAMEELCRRYWLPVYVAVRGSGRAPHDAEDLTQAFFASLIGRDAFQRPTPEKGRFRTFMLTALDRFLVDDWRRSQTQKRGGEYTFVPLDREIGEQRFEVAARMDQQPDRLFERQWARELIDRTLSQLQVIFEEEGRGRQFTVLRSFLASQGREGSYTEISRELGVTEHNARTMLYRLRRRFRALLREEIAETVAEGVSVDEEIRNLFAIFHR